MSDDSGIFVAISLAARRQIPLRHTTRALLLPMGPGPGRMRVGVAAERRVPPRAGRRETPLT
ncbi:MAG: hypothetical protein QFX32_05120 [Methanolinea sp.]|nr:hypothetical protein [Methanolinea sp.]